MKTVAGAAIAVLALVVASWAADSASDVTGSRSVDSLKFVVVVCRHGNRAAHKDYALDPYPLNDTKHYPYGKGALTPQGRVHMHKMGMKLRALYNGFLSSTFYPSEIHATSSPTERTLMSGQALLAGLYPPRGFQVWNKDVLWQPVPLYSTSPDNAHNIRECQKFLVAMEKEKIDFHKDSNVSEVVDYYNGVTGSNASNQMIWFIWDKLISENTEGFVIPEWTKKIFPEPMLGLITRQYRSYYASTDSIVRIITGNLVEEIMTTMKKKIEGELQSRRINVYSGHDSSLIPLMVGLGVPRSAVPLVKPGSALLLELHQDTATTKHFVKVLYIDGGSVELEPQPLTLPDCGQPCDFTRLLNTTSWLFGLNYSQECLVPGFDVDLMRRNNWTQ